jgi:hypothetical protein
MTFIREGKEASARNAPPDAVTIYSGSALFRWLDKQFLMEIRLPPSSGVAASRFSKLARNGNSGTVC